MNKIEIDSFSVINYRSIAECELDLSAGAVGLIGVNAAGKTNIGRAVAFFFGLIQNNLLQIHPKTPRSMVESLPMTEMAWQPLGVPPNALLAQPSPGQRASFQVKCRFPSFMLPEGKGELIKNLNRQKEAHNLKISCVIEAQRLPTGELGLVPTFDVVISTKQLYLGDLLALQNLWKLFITSRVQAMQPANEFLNALNNLRQSSVAGHLAYDGLNETVQSLDPNFARVSFISRGPVAIEGDIPDLTVDNMSSGNLRALQILSTSKTPELEKTILLHVEEPETHFHPSLQRSVVRKLLAICSELQMRVFVETHSPHVLAELYSSSIPVYRVEVLERDEATRIRKSRVTPLPCGKEAIRFLNVMGFEAGFAVLGGTLVIVDGVTDVPVYRTFLSQFPEVTDHPVVFLPIGSLESSHLDLSEVTSLTRSVAVVADGHFLKHHGERLKEKCLTAGIEYIPLNRWGVENFFCEEVLREGAKEIQALRIGDDLSLDPMIPLKDTTGIDGLSKSHHNTRLAELVSRKYLEQQEDFMRIITFLSKEAAQQKNPPAKK